MLKKKTRRILALYSLVVLISALPIVWKVVLALPAIIWLLLDFDEYNYQLKNGGTK